MNYFKDKLDTIKDNNLYRTLKHISSAQEPKVTIDNKEYILLGSNNYLGLCNDQRVKTAAINAATMYGVGSGGSRLTTGSHVLHKELENKLAIFKQTDDCLIYSSGYMANLGVISSICNRHWVVFSDRLNHASIIDGIKLSGAKMVRYDHCNIKDLKKKIELYKGSYNLLVTDGVFSMDGDISPLNEIVSLCNEHNIMVMVDDAHGTGTIGKDGQGVDSYLNVSSDIDIKVGTLSKAIGCEGGYVCSSKSIIDYLRNTSRSFIYSTSLSPIIISSALTALDIISCNSELRNTLLNNTRYFRENLVSLGFNTLDSITPIIPIFVGDSLTAQNFSKQLLNEGIYIPCIRPPTVPEGTSRLRVSLMATHTREELDYVLNKLSIIGKKLNIIGELNEK
ncbi:MAG: 8-amino-7-oxononanoate synthase [Clostridium sp.]